MIWFNPFLIASIVVAFHVLLPSVILINNNVYSVWLNDSSSILLHLFGLLFVCLFPEYTDSILPFLEKVKGFFKNF